MRRPYIAASGTDTPGRRLVWNFPQVFDFRRTHLT